VGLFLLPGESNILGRGVGVLGFCILSSPIRSAPLQSSGRPAVTADPVVGIIEFYQGDRLIGLKGQVEVRLDRTLRT
jgi:hypothetical protein